MNLNSALGEQYSEEAGYFEVSGGHLYAVWHKVPNPIARVLLVGPFASERHLSYLPWIGWARYLANSRIESLRYDYRGIGESTGTFEEMTFDAWNEDVEGLATWLKNQSPAAPVIIHGLELGGLLAAHAFAKGLCDNLLLWSPPSNANNVLHTQLVRMIAQEQLFKYGNERKTLSDYIRQLERGNTIEVSGYQWSAKLWNDSFNFKLPANIRSSDGSGPSSRVKTVELDNRAAPLVKGSSVGYDAISKDFGWLFADNLEWITSTLTSISSGVYEARY